MKNKGKPSTLKPLDFKLNIRAPNMYLGSKSYHNSLVDQLMNYLYDYFIVYATSICFPELTVPTIVQLKRLIKNGTDYNLNKQVGVFLEKLEENSRFVVSKRQGVEFGPKDVVMCLDFVAQNCPFQKYYEQRKKIKDRQVVKEEMVFGESDDEPEEENGSGGEDDEDDDGMGSEEDEDVQSKPLKGKGSVKRPVFNDYEDDGMDEDLVEDFEMSD
jgi:nucleolar complex protein 2